MRSLRAQLTLGFFTAAVAAVALMAFAVLPGLETRLVDARLDDLAKLSRQYSPRLREAVGTIVPQTELKDLVQSTADTTGARVTVLLVVVDSKEGLTVVPGTDFRAPGRVRLSYACSLEQIGEAVKRIGALGQV